MDGLTRFYKFTVLPFGLSTGPYIFTKVTRPLVRYWRLQAFRIAVYLDNGLGVCPTFTDCCSQSMSVKSDLFHAGFVVNTKKSFWAPVQCFVANTPKNYLGSSSVSSLVRLLLGFKG